MNAWYAKLQAAGYNNLSVYSYTNYLDTALNSANIRNKTRWVASYGARTNFPFATNDRGWQYTSQGSVAGIQGSVDLNAFGNKESSTTINLLWQIREDDIAVGAAVSSSSSNVEYKWMSYNVNTQEWKTIADWTGSNWAGWADNKGTYWLHVKVRDALSKKNSERKRLRLPMYRDMVGLRERMPGGKKIEYCSANHLIYNQHITK